MITIDRDTASVTLVRSDRKEASFPLEPSPFEDTSALSRLHYSPGLPALIAVTRAGDDIAFELPTEDSEQLRGRRVVYLDQNLWSTFDNTRHNPQKVSAEDRHAVERIIDWVQQQRIILAASAGHYYETAKRFNPAARYRLGLTIMQLSRGWQMRDPLQVRLDELRVTFQRRFDTATGSSGGDVFTLCPEALYGPNRGIQPYRPPTDFPPDMAFMLQALTSATASIDAMLDSEHIAPDSRTGWVEANQRFSDWLDGQDRDAQQKRQTIDALLLSDLQGEVAQAAHATQTSLDQLKQWVLNHRIEDLRQLPALGLFREMLHDRHLNKGIKWRSSDVVDMVYLSCAAGYAPFVACERHMAAILAQGVKRLGRSTQVFGRLPDAVPAIEASLTSS